MNDNRFNPVVNVIREGVKSPVVSYSVEGTAKVVIEDLCGYDFISNEIKEHFILEVEDFKKTFTNYPDNFNEDDRTVFKEYVQSLLIGYYNEGKIQ